MTTFHSGSCHCGDIGVELATEIAEADIAPRACGCDFCLKHRPSWFSDVNGPLMITHAVDPIRYRFGSETADFLICPRCGVLIAATCEVETRVVGVFNLNCLDIQHDWSARAVAVDYDGESTGDRLGRRARNWMPVELEGTI